MNCNDCYPFLQTRYPGVGYPVSSLPSACKSNIAYIRQNFTVPAIGVAVIVETTDSSLLTVGQGVLIGGGFFQVTDIIDSLKIELKHAGLGTSEGLSVIAVHPQYGCYQYPLFPVGKVSLDYNPAVVALDGAGSGIIFGGVVSTSKNIITVGYLGPTTIQVNVDVIAELANNPFWIGVALPIPVRLSGAAHVFSAYVEDGGAPKVAVAKTGAGAYVDYMIIGLGDTNQMSNGTNRRFVASGSYEILV